MRDGDSPSSSFGLRRGSLRLALRLSEDWWRRRESNPRPKTFHLNIYILILKFRFRRLSLLQAGYPTGYPAKVRRYRHGQPVPTIPLVDALTGCAGVTRQNAGLFMRPGHIHNHLRLCLDPVILTSRQELGMQSKLLYPRRSRFAPKTHRWEIPNHKHQITKQIGFGI